MRFPALIVQSKFCTPILQPKTVRPKERQNTLAFNSLLSLVQNDEPTRAFTRFQNLFVMLRRIFYFFRKFSSAICLGTFHDACDQVHYFLSSEKSPT